MNAVKLQVAVLFVVNAILEKFSRAFSLLVPDADVKPADIGFPDADVRKLI